MLDVEGGMWDVKCGMWKVRMWNVECEMLDMGFGMGHAARECSPTDHADFHRCRAGCFYQKNTRPGEAPPTNGRYLHRCARMGLFTDSLLLLRCPLLGFDAQSAQRIDTNKHRCHSGCFYQKHEYLSWHAPFSPSHAPFLYVNVVLKRRKPVCTFAHHSFLYYTINTRYDRRQLSYQQRTCVHNAFDDIMEYTIECDDPLETKGIVADIKRR